MKVYWLVVVPKGLAPVVLVGGLFTSAQFTSNVTNGSISLHNLYLQDSETGTTYANGTLGDCEGNIILFLVNGIINVTGY